MWGTNAKVQVFRKERYTLTLRLFYNRILSQIKKKKSVLIRIVRFQC